MTSVMTNLCTILDSWQQRRPRRCRTPPSCRRPGCMRTRGSTATRSARRARPWSSSRSSCQLRAPTWIRLSCGGAPREDQAHAHGELRRADLRGGRARVRPAGMLGLVQEKAAELSCLLREGEDLRDPDLYTRRVVFSNAKRLGGVIGNCWRCVFSNFARNPRLQEFTGYSWRC